MAKPAAHVLVIEDNPAAFFLVKKAFARESIATPLEHCDDGAAALAVLRAAADADSRALPALVLLDLNLPGMDGRDVLKEIRSDDRLRHLPVVIMTSSEQEQDILESYAHGASSYVTKPPTLAQLQVLARRLHDYWFDVVRLPGVERPG